MKWLRYGVLIILILIQGSLFGQKLNELFIVGKAQRITNEIVPGDKKDANLKQAALVSFITDLEVGMDFRPWNGAVDITHPAMGRWNVYVSPGERAIDVHAEGFKPLKVVLSTFGISNLKSGEVYHLEISGNIERQFTGKGNFFLETTPPEAKITIDGISGFQENTPYYFNDFLAGYYKLHLEKDRYEPIDTLITIEKDEKGELKLELQPLFGDLIVISQPSGCKVLLDGKKAGTTPLYLTGVDKAPDIGEHSITIQKSNYHKKSYDNHQKLINIEPFQTVTVNASLTEKKGILVLDSNLKETEFTVVDKETGDNVYKGKAINELPLLTGEYEITAETPECLPKKMKVQIEQNKTSTININFQQADYRAYQSKKQRDRENFRDLIYKDKHGNYGISESLIGFALDPLKSTTPAMICFGEDFKFYRLTLLAKLVEVEKTYSLFTYGASLLGNGTITSGHDVKGWFDLVSLNGGMILFSRNFRSRLLLDCDFGLKIGWTDLSSTYDDYNGNKIKFGDLYESEDGDRTFNPPWQWAPLDLSLTYEIHISGQSFFMIRAGLLYFCPSGEGLNWYNKSEADNWVDNGGDKPEPLYGDDLPPVPYVKGYEPYFGVGIRF